MNREVPYSDFDICDHCGNSGAFDFMGDLICSNCIPGVMVQENQDAGFYDAEPPRPCVVCDKMLRSAVPFGWKTLQPAGGGEIRLLFCYGSEKFDLNLGGTGFRGLICDECAEKMIPKMEKYVEDSDRE